MRFINIIILFFIVFICCYACIDRFEFEIEEPVNFQLNEEATSDITTVINAFKQSDQQIFTFDAEHAILVQAYIISSDEAGNFYKTLIIQDSPENPKSGLEIKIDLRSYYSKYNFGRRILLRLSGLSIQEDNGKYVVGYLSGNALVDIPESLLDHFILRFSETSQIMPKSIRLEEISQNSINTYVVIEQVQFLMSDIGKSFAAEAYDKYNGQRLIEQCDNLAKSYLYTSSYADFSTNLLPESSLCLTAVLTADSYSKEVIFVMNIPEDIELLDQQRCDPIFYECPETPLIDKKQILYYENFERLASTRDIEKIGWQNINVNFGNGRFRKRSKKENTFVQISAYDSREFVMEVWLLSPAIDLDQSVNEFLTFDTRATFEEGSVLTCWFSEDYKNDVKDATWEQLDIEISVGSGDGSNELFQDSGTIVLDCIDGNIRLAFRYMGSDPGISTTYDLDNILILGDKILE
ncbi:MAG: hypothetical protein GY908_00115 [Flavobacteriales bacterium]|nr:hypothetical protein [Flavobacteriales bacterium]